LPLVGSGSVFVRVKFPSARSKGKDDDRSQGQDGQATKE
jgi:hypothetical protein